MSDYDPLLAGAFRVKCETHDWSDPARDGRAVVTEVWSPDAPDRFPLVLFSHHSYGQRRQSAFLAEHLASHGYVVAAPDHRGNTIEDLTRRTAAPAAPRDPMDLIRDVSDNRAADLRFVIDRCCDLLADRIRDDAVAAVGHSWGGWSVLQLAAHDRRVCSVVGLAPGGGRTHLVTDCLREWLEVEWGRAVPTLLLAAEFDSHLPLDGVRGLYERLAAPKRLLVLQGADHGFFVDDIEGSYRAMRQWLDSAPPDRQRDVTLELMKPLDELCAPEQAKAAVKAVTLAHLDATLKATAGADAWLQSLPLDGVRAP